MPDFNIVRNVKVPDSFRVESVIGQFDLDRDQVKEKFKGKLPLEEKDWQIGVITGHSGTGKSTIAQELWGDAYIEKFEYNSDSILDDMPDRASVKEITRTFNSVGFSSPPSWLKPYSVLSTGEKMRVNLARAILENDDLIVFDEFTSTVDRDVAQVGSAALSKAVRRTDKRFIAVSCHDDILEWLEPDWVFNTNKMEFEWIKGDRLRRPEIELDIYRERGKWEIFRKYHYLSHKLNKAAHEYVGYYESNPVAYQAVLHHPHKSIKNFKRSHRLVVLPDYQGVGIGTNFQEYIADYYLSKGFRFIETTSNPALINHRKKSSKWALKDYRHQQQSAYNYQKGKQHTNEASSAKRLTTSWEYTG